MTHPEHHPKQNVAKDMAAAWRQSWGLRLPHASPSPFSEPLRWPPVGTCLWSRVEVTEHLRSGDARSCFCSGGLAAPSRPTCPDLLPCAAPTPESESVVAVWTFPRGCPRPVSHHEALGVASSPPLSPVQLSEAFLPNRHCHSHVLSAPPLTCNQPVTDTGHPSVPAIVRDGWRTVPPTWGVSVRTGRLKTWARRHARKSQRGRAGRGAESPEIVILAHRPSGGAHVTAEGRRPQGRADQRCE